MITRLKSILINSALVMALGLSFSCASDQQQGQGDQLESQGDYEDSEGEDQQAGNEGEGYENEGEGEGQQEANSYEEGESNNYAENEGGDEELNDSDVAEENGYNEGANVTEENLGNDEYSEGENYGNGDSLVNDTENEGELDQVIDEMNEGDASELEENNAGLEEPLAEEAPIEEAPMEEAPMEEAPMEEAVAETQVVVGTQAAPGLPELGSKMSYIVQKGDSLVKIATRIYGKSNKVD